MFLWRSLFLYEQNHLLHSLLLLGLSVRVRVITAAALMMVFVSTSRFIKKPNKQHGYLGGMEARLDPSVAEMGPCEYCFVSLWGL